MAWGKRQYPGTGQSYVRDGPRRSGESMPRRWRRYRGSTSCLFPVDDRRTSVRPARFKPPLEQARRAEGRATMVKRLAVAGTNGQQLPISFGVSWFGVSWDVCVQVLLSAAIIMATALPVARLVGTAGEQMQVIVREMDGAGSGPEHLVRQLGGKVNFELPVIGGFSATIPASAIDAVAAGPRHQRRHARRPGPLQLDRRRHSTQRRRWARCTTRPGRLAPRTCGSSGITGKGIDVAVIDTGVSPDPDFAGRLINGPDLSFDSQRLHRVTSTGTAMALHMASIIAARDSRCRDERPACGHRELRRHGARVPAWSTSRWVRRTA